LGSVVFVIINYSVLAGNGGWGLLSIPIFIVLAFSLWFLDGLIYYFVNKESFRIAVSILVLISFLIYLFSYSGLFN